MTNCREIQLFSGQRRCFEKHEKIKGHKNWGSRAISRRNRAREKEIVPRHEGSETSG